MTTVNPGNAASAHPRELSPQVEEQVCRIIRERMGIVIHDHQLTNLRDTLGRVCDRFGYKDCADFAGSLATLAQNTPAMEFLVAGITVGESYFFRDEEQFRFLKEVWLPDVVREKRLAGSKTLRVWSAGCAMGQEIRSVAILLREHLPDFDDWALHLLATDINVDSLAAAIRGRYNQWSLRATPDWIRDKYFTVEDGQYVVAEGVRNQVKFAYLNLTDDAFPSILSETEAFDLILCRNVFIYLDRTVAQRVTAKFTASLAPGGVLLLGASDLVDWAVPGLAMRSFGHSHYFARVSAKPVAAAAPASELPSTPVPMPAVSLKTAKKERIPQARRLPEQREKCFQGLVDLVRAERWSEVVAAADAYMREHGESPEVLQCKAKALANLGELGVAAEACERAIALDPVDKHVYLIKSLVMQELGRVAEAESGLRKAIYLDHTFVEAHYRLGLLQLRAGNGAVGMKHLHNALQLAQSGNPEWPLHNASAMTYGRLAEILRSEIDMYGGKR